MARMTNQGPRMSQGGGSKGNMTVREAGRKGGQTTSRTHGHDFYEEIGHKGGQRVRQLINQGKQTEMRGR